MNYSGRERKGDTCWSTRVGDEEQPVPARSTPSKDQEGADFRIWPRWASPGDMSTVALTHLHFDQLQRVSARHADEDGAVKPSSEHPLATCGAGVRHDARATAEAACCFSEATTPLEASGN